MTFGVTVSSRRASLNCTWVPCCELLVKGTSKPRDITALAFSTVTILGSESERALPWVSSAWMARFRLKSLATRPKAVPRAAAGGSGGDLAGAPLGHVRLGVALADQRRVPGVPRLADRRPAPGDADLLQRALGGDHHLGGDLHLGQRDVERLLDELHDPVEVILVEADEYRVGGLVGPHREPP